MISNVRESVLIVSNDPRHCSGVGGECRHICLDLWRNGYQPVVVSYSMQPDPAPVNVKFPGGEEVMIYGTKLVNEMFNSIDLIIQLAFKHDPKCLVLFDDPRRFLPLLDHVLYFRGKIPLYFVAVWDTYLSPDPASEIPHFNLTIYECFDGIGCISRQTDWFIKNCFAKSKYTPAPPIHYVGHGSDPNVFRPLPPEETEETRKFLFQNREPNFVALCINQNQGRKKIPDLIEAWRIFFRGLTKEQQDGAALVLKTSATHPLGTDLNVVIEALAPNCNIHLFPGFVSDTELAKIYNCVDVFVNCANAEGFGLTSNEAMLCGVPVILNATGGLVDQMGFPGEWKPNYEDFIDDENCQPGEWCFPLYGQRTIIGSPITPYLYDQNASIDDIVNGLKYWYDVNPETRKKFGLSGRQWCLDKGLTSTSFAGLVVRDIQRTIKDFKPHPTVSLYAA